VRRQISSASCSTHPGFVDAELQRLDPLTTLREREYAFLAGDAFLNLLAGHGAALA
jgi:predicted glycoside hydrolase/deacetylase ChbG (UPF0249 family)